MKARVKATGEIVEVNQCSILYEDGKRELMYGRDLEEVQGAPDYWTRLEHQAAIAAMQGMLSNSNITYKDISNEIICNHWANNAIAIAHALVEKYKKE